VSLPLLKLVLNLLTLGLFLGLVVHAVHRGPHGVDLPSGASASDIPRRSHSVAALVARCLLALGLALGGVVVMVRAGTVAGTALQLPSALLSVVVLAVATSLPNLVVALELARTSRAGTSVEEIASSNAIIVALGCALPALLWTSQISDPSLLRVDLPLLSLLGLVVVGLVQTRRIPRLVGASLLGVYILWVVLHVVL
jgi:Ca2+/Na+ antiporter